MFCLTAKKKSDREKKLKKMNMFSIVFWTFTSIMNMFSIVSWTFTSMSYFIFLLKCNCNNNTVATFKLSNIAEAVPLDECRMISDKEA